MKSIFKPRTKEDTNKLEHMPLAYKLAWQFHKSNGIDIDELISEATYLYLKALNTFDDSFGTKPTTHIYKVITNGLMTFCNKEHEHNQHPALSEYEDQTSFIYSYNFSEKLYLEQFSEKTREMISWILKDALSPVEILFSENKNKTVEVNECTINWDMAGKNVRGELITYFRKIGWKWGDIWASFTEIKQFVRNN